MDLSQMVGRVGPMEDQDLLMKYLMAQQQPVMMRPPPQEQPAPQGAKKPPMDFSGELMDRNEADKFMAARPGAPPDAPLGEKTERAAQNAGEMPKEAPEDLADLMAAFNHNQNRDKRMAQGAQDISTGLSSIGSNVANAYNMRAWGPAGAINEPIKNDWAQARLKDINDRASPAVASAYKSQGIDMPEGMSLSEIKTVGPVVERGMAMKQDQANSDRTFAARGDERKQAQADSDRLFKLNEEYKNAQIEKMKWEMAHPTGGVGINSPVSPDVLKSLQEVYSYKFPDGVTRGEVSEIVKRLNLTERQGNTVKNQATRFENTKTASEIAFDRSQKAREEYTPSLAKVEIDKFTDELDKDVELTAEMKAIRVAGKIKSMLELGRSNQVGANLSVNMMARDLGNEKGPLSDQDVERWFGSRGLPGLQQFFSLWTSGNYDDDTIVRLEQVLAKAYPESRAKADQILKSKLAIFQAKLRGELGSNLPGVLERATTIAGEYRNQFLGYGGQPKAPQPQAAGPAQPSSGPPPAPAVNKTTIEFNGKKFRATPDQLRNMQEAGEVYKVIPDGQ
jgi:hypothetical protein